MTRIYKIKKAFIVPFIIITALLCVLLALSFLSGQAWERIILAVLFIVTLAIAIEVSERKIIVSENELGIKKFFRTKNFTWSEITHLGVVIMRSKAYFLLTTTKGFYIFSNLLQDHAGLIRHLVSKLDEDRVEVEIKNYLENPVERMSIIIMTWVAVFVLVAIIVTKLFKF